MKPASALLLAVACLVPAQASAVPCTAPPSGKRLEMTQHDFTREASLCSLRMSLYGIYLGQAREDALAAITSAGFTPREMQGDNAITEVHYIFARRGHSLVKYFTLQIRSERVETITLHAAMQALLPGESAMLLDAESALPDSPVRRRLLGREDEAHVSPDSATYAYFAEGLELALVPPDPTNLRLVELTLRFPARAR
jgi:hypothetical protein